MAFLDEVATLVESSTVAGGATGWLLFKGIMPDSTAIGDKAVALVQSAGLGRMGRVDIDRPRLQVWIRGSVNHTSTDAYEAAKSKANEVRDALHEYTGSDLTSGTHYLGIWCDNMAFAGWDEGNRPLFAGNFRVQRSP